MSKKWCLFLCLLFNVIVGFVKPAGAAVPKKYTLWLCPHPFIAGTTFNGVFDFYFLFDTYYPQWPNIRSHVEVFAFYQYQFEPDTGVFTNAQIQTIVDKLSQSGINMAFESGAVKEWSPDGTIAALNTNAAINRVESLGGNVRFIAMDEPLWAGQFILGEPLDNTINGVVNYMNRVKSSHPDVLIGDIVAYPSLPMVTTISYLEGLKQRTGKWLPFVQLDVDLNDLKKRGLDLSEIIDLRAFCASHGIEFGIIFTHNELEASSNLDYYNGTLLWAASINSLMGMPDQVISQSWQDKPDYCIPENSSYTFLHVTSTLFSNYGPNDNGQYVSNTIPSNMVGGQIYNVSVAMRNTGKSTWTKGANFKLILDPNIASVWGTASVLLENDESIAPGQTKTFQFSVTAPSSSGSYPCNWMMRVGSTVYRLFGKVCYKNVSVSGAQLINNGGFETGTGGDATSWTEGNGHARNSGKKYSGSYSLKATCSGTSASSRTLSFSVTPNTNYTFSAWVYNSLASGNAYLDMNDIAGEAGMSSTRGNNQWQYLSKVWNSGANNSLTVRCVTDANPQGTVWFDDIKLKN